MTSGVGGLGRNGLLDRLVPLAGPVVVAGGLCPLGADPSMRGDADRAGRALGTERRTQTPLIIWCGASGGQAQLGATRRTPHALNTPSQFLGISSLAVFSKGPTLRTDKTDRRVQVVTALGLPPRRVVEAEYGTDQYGPRRYRPMAGGRYNSCPDRWVFPVDHMVERHRHLAPA